METTHFKKGFPYPSFAENLPCEFGVASTWRGPLPSRPRTVPRSDHIPIQTTHFQPPSEDAEQKPQICVNEFTIAISSGTVRTVKNVPLQ